MTRIPSNQTNIDISSEVRNGLAYRRKRKTWYHGGINQTMSLEMATGARGERETPLRL